MSYPRRQCEHDYPHNGHTWYNPEWGKGYVLGSSDDTKPPFELRCAGIKGERVNPPAVRRAVVDKLRAISKRVGWLVSDWQVDGKLWTGAGNGGTRPRAIAEYPENSYKTWAQLASECDYLIEQVEQVRREAIRRTAEITRNKIAETRRTP